MMQAMPGSCPQSPRAAASIVRIYFHFVARNLEMPDNGTVYHGNFVGEATAGTVKVHSVEGIGR